MKPNQNPENDRALDQAMKRWVVDSSLPSRFQEQVWQRIARAETQPVPPTLFSSALLTLYGLFARPKFAYSYVAILVLLGILTGSLVAQRHASHLNTTLGSRYVQSIDPYYEVALNP